MTPGKFAVDHIPGSYNVPLDLLREHRDELHAHLGENVVLVCRSGQRAGHAEQLLRAAGLPHVRVLAGGITAWQGAAAPLRTGRPRWDLERQVRLTAGLLVLVAVLASAIAGPVKWVAAVVEAGLTVAALTGTCLMGSLLARLPYNRAPRTDVGDVVAALTGGAT
ncbi:sulfurtransferase [Actinoplanes lobatus]|uniref:Sulfurtransferase n=1 Tax=Actinoplanes lobatus TaxID=113568 RepID=A0A7W7HN61_9ACTN|nr:rhodanese-like domain-containing protein [Actinoplanes lobatus]MBB4753566.1 rhodanese-related sulfurtransferase [Actinoplanes lobatus]GGN84778.1 sulfurtransferase [Actinoplanes lobatus]GIE38102.1 sulfurtransferase [Actinoplanes lobatus]